MPARVNSTNWFRVRAADALYELPSVCRGGYRQRTRFVVGSTMRPATLRRLPGLCLSLAVALGFWHFASTIYDRQIDARRLTRMEHVAHFKTENAFYASYFDDALRAPSPLAALRGVVRNNRTEYPNTINALHRFNVAQVREESTTVLTMTVIVLTVTAIVLTMTNTLQRRPGGHPRARPSRSAHGGCVAAGTPRRGPAPPRHSLARRG